MQLSREERREQYVQILTAQKTDEDRQEAMRELCKVDLFFLLTRVLNRKDLDTDFHFARCCEVQRDPDGYLDLWSREFGKSSIITFGKTIQDIVKNPEVTIGIFACTKPIARAFLRQIKYELETNQYLKSLFPDIFYDHPKKESPGWGEDKGITVKRTQNPKEATVEAHGLVDGQPTSRHFDLLVYDDVVTLESVSTPEMIEKVTNAWALSLNLGAKGGARRYIGTRYHHADTYKSIMDREAAVPRIYPATDDGTMEGEPVLISLDALRQKRREMGPYVFAAQMLLNPTVDSAEGFDVNWIKHWKADKAAGLNIYIVVDPAHSKKKGSDWTVMWVIGLGPDENYYAIDIVRDRMNLTERAQTLFKLHRKYRPIRVGYERYGLQADIEHIEYMQTRYNYRFDVVELGGKTPKPERIKRLIPIYESGRFYLPVECNKVSDGKTVDLVQIFINEEYIPFPAPVYDDMLDSQARILDQEMDAVFPTLEDIPMDMEPEAEAAY